MSEDSDLGIHREPLTARQRQVLDLIARGYTNGQIADELGITLDGAKWHVREILTKLGVENREGAAAWWSQRQSPVRRLERVLRAAATPAALKIAGAAAAVGAVAVIGVAAIALAGARDDQPPPAGASAQETPGAADVTPREWQVTSAAPLPPGVLVYLATGCWGCDGPHASLQRIVNMDGGGAGHVERRTLFTAPGGGESYILSLKSEPGGGITYATVCSQGYCGGSGPMTADAESTLYRSTNGGITWVAAGRYPGWLAVIGRVEQGLMLASYESEDASSPRYFLQESGEDVAGRGPDFVPVPAGGKLSWLSGSQLLDPEGEVLFELPAEFDGSFQPLEPANLDVASFAIRLSGGSDGTVTGLVQAGELQAVLTGPAVTIGGWLSGSIAVGNAILDAGQIPGVVAGGTGSEAYPLPVLMNFEAGTLTPLEIDGPIFESETYRGRNTILAVAQGRWYEVAGDGECLRLRSEPSLDAGNIQGCYSDGVLFQAATATEVQADGVTWVQVRTPDGLAGWASREFLED